MSSSGPAQFPTIAALVPMKAHSERVPGKNLRHLCDKPLFYWILDSLTRSSYIHQIFIDTDSSEIATQVRQYFDVSILDRPEHLCGDMFVANDLIEYDLTQIKGIDFFLQTHSTNPLVKTETIDKAIEAFFLQAEHDSLFSVTRLQKRFYWPDGRPVNHEIHDLIRTQDLPSIYEENSCIYLFSRHSFSSRRSRIGEAPLLFEISPEEACDIDEELDFVIVELLMKRRLQMARPNGSA